MKFFGLQERTPIGIDIGGTHIKAVQLSHGPRGWQIESAAVIPRLEVNSSLNRAEVRRLTEVLSRRSFVGRKIVLPVPEDKLIAGTMELPARSTGISLDAAARTEFARAYKCEAHSFEMAYWDLPAPARAARTTNVMAVACTHAHADELISLFAGEHLEVVGLDARSWAMARGCVGAIEGSTGIVLLVEIGWNGSRLVILHHGVVVYERMLADAGMRTLQQELESESRITADVAAFVLQKVGLKGDEVDESDVETSVSIPEELRAEVCSVASAHFEKLGRELLESLSYTSHQYPNTAVSRLLLLGGGAMIPGLAEKMQGLVGFDTRIVTPLASAACSPSIAQECVAILTTATGLARFGDI